MFFIISPQCQMVTVDTMQSFHFIVKYNNILIHVNQSFNGFLPAVNLSCDSPRLSEELKKVSFHLLLHFHQQITDDCRRLQTTVDDCGRLQTTVDDCRRLQMTAMCICCGLGLQAKNRLMEINSPLCPPPTLTSRAHQFVSHHIVTLQ